MSKKITKTNPRIIQLISKLKAVSREGGVHIWWDIARRLERPTRQYPQVNLGKINRYTNTDDTVIIPGKVLGAGNIKHKVTVAALNFSDTAVEKITNSGGLCLKIEDLLTENPSGSAVKIIQ